MVTFDPGMDVQRAGADQRLPLRDRPEMETPRLYELFAARVREFAGNGNNRTQLFSQPGFSVVVRIRFAVEEGGPEYVGNLVGGLRETHAGDADAQGRLDEVYERFMPKRVESIAECA